MKLLLIEDEMGIASMIRRGLEKADYQVDLAADGLTGLHMAQENAYHLVILDLMLPRMDGLRICDALREHGNPVPILMLTARDAVEDRILGLDMGADDYLPKPFDFQELLARIRVLLRRERSHRKRVLRVADLVIDTAQRRVTRAGTEIGLSHREYELLEALAACESQVLTREIIQERIWMSEDSYSNTVDVCIKVLRKKVDADYEVKLIHTVRGTGYTLRVPDGEEPYAG